MRTIRKVIKLPKIIEKSYKISCSRLNAQHYYSRTATSPYRTAQKNKPATKCSDSVLFRARPSGILGKGEKGDRFSRDSRFGRQFCERFAIQARTLRTIRNSGTDSANDSQFLGKRARGRRISLSERKPIPG